MSLESEATEMAEIRSMAMPLRTADDLDPLVERLAGERIIALGEASHGTHEFYAWRCESSRRLIERGGISFIGVEGDWPDCWRIDQWVRGREEVGSDPGGSALDARHVLAQFERWPRWMWANEEVADFLDWLRAHNLARPMAERVGFFGLDVYSLWDSLREVFAWLERNAPEAVPMAMRAWECFAPFDEQPQRYAHSTALVPESCEDDVVALLVAVRHRVAREALPDEGAFGAAQNAAVVAGAERYYRAMVRSDRTSWNIRDFHMADTLDRLLQHFGARSRALVWAHNTHVGDSRATDMAAAGMVNIGEILRDRHDDEGVALIGFAGHRGAVMASAAWGADEVVFEVPTARLGSHEDLLHRALGAPSLLIFPHRRGGLWLRMRRGHRAIGVVYQPRHEHGNYVPTVMGDRYDALLWLEDTSALAPLHHEPPPREAEYETQPSGY